MGDIESWLQECFNDLIRHKELKNVTKMLNFTGRRLGEEMVVIVSDIHRCSLVLETVDGGTRTLDILVKMEPQGPMYNHIFKQFGFFETEIMMYEKTLVEMEKLIFESSISEETLWPVCYLCRDSRLIIQDLNMFDFRTVPPENYLDLDHIVLVMSAIGKFHALSAVLLERKLVYPKDFKPTLLDKKVSFIVKMYSASITKLAEVIADYWEEPQWSGVPERLLKAIDNVGNKMADIYQKAMAKWSFMVLNHGDFSIKNLLFQYKAESSQPTSVKFVDFQGCHLSSPARDLGTILYTSVMPQLREENLNTILRVYYDSLVETCIKLNYNGQLPSFDDIRTSLESMSYWTGIISLCSLPVFLSSNRKDYKEEVEKLIDSKDDDKSKPKGAVSKAFYRIVNIENALKYEVKRCIDANIF